MRRFLTLFILLSTFAGCTSSSTGPAASAPPTEVARPTVRLGYFPNLTHAPALVAIEQGLFERALGDAATLDTRVFNAGPSTVEALMSGSLDVTYIGPNPTINAHVRSKGDAVRVIAGASSGGAALVVAPGIEKADDLRGKVVASPQLGGTQDVALRIWLKKAGLNVALQGGDVQVLPQENAQSLETFRTGKIAGAWVPEPWVSRLVREGGGRVLVDERTLWPEGRFVTTHLVARRVWLEANPTLADKLLDAHLDALASMERDAAGARAAVIARIGKLTGQAVAPALIDAAWPSLTFTADPLAATLRTAAEHAESVGLVPKAEVTFDSLYALERLNQRLVTRGLMPYRL